ncbi:GTP-binding protein Di-Ras2-like isoform X2 [Hydractinia symbiolongicarpus]|uniref:GTP-binding protein Di-Ras2-like isoform X2 n=1 Tax=Hydractinia symbiolongicarpus TaxID=13093 RepID=UPI00254F4BCD|nr:GTP-binding protein Di-Ras2-like isoform X2 [Hydractinia symbiolongicarpus]
MKKFLSRKIFERNPTPIQTIRIVMFGLGGVGKTSLIHRFLFNKFNSTYTATIEDDYRQVITYNNHIVDVTVLDTAGSYQFPAMRRHAIQHGHGFVIVYAVDNADSIEEAKRLYQEIKENTQSENFPVILAGNKVDKSPLGKRKISTQQASEVIKEWGSNAEHIETSAKLNQNVSLVFNKLIDTIDERNIETLTFSNCTRSTMRLPTSKHDIRRTYSLENNLADKSLKKNEKKKMFLRKLFSRKTIR